MVNQSYHTEDITKFRHYARFSDLALALRKRAVIHWQQSGTPSKARCGLRTAKLVATLDDTRVTCGNCLNVQHYRLSDEGYYG